MKQISIVLEIDDNIDELLVIKQIKDFLNKFKNIKQIGTHVKLKNYE